MKRVFLTAVLALALPLAAYADNVEFTDHSGTLSGSAAGLTLIGSKLTEVDGVGGLGLIQGVLGSMSFTTGMLTSGSLMNGATFAAGGTFIITGNGTDGIPDGVIFSGTFSSPVSWTEETTSNDVISYILGGAVSGTWYNGTKVNGATTLIAINAGKNGFPRSLAMVSGETILNTSAVPEPRTLLLFGTGSVALAGIVWRRLKTQASRFIHPSGKECRGARRTGDHSCTSLLL